MLAQTYFKGHHDNSRLSYETSDIADVGMQHVNKTSRIGHAKKAYFAKNQPGFFYLGSQSQNVNSSIFSRDHQTKNHGSTSNFSGLQVVLLIRIMIFKNVIDID